MSGQSPVASIDVADDGRRALLEALGVYGNAYGELGRRFTASLGLGATDSRALIEIITSENVGAPLTPTRLSGRIGLSSGATATLLNRLETAGHVVRSREHDDRRVVTLRSSRRMHDHAERFFEPLTERLDRVLDEHAGAVAEAGAMIADLAREVNDHAR